MLAQQVAINLYNIMSEKKCFYNVTNNYIMIYILISAYILLSIGTYIFILLLVIRLLKLYFTINIPFIILL